MNASKPAIRAASTELVEELMGASVSVPYLLERLMELPAGVLPGGDDRADSIRELLIACALREAGIHGEEACRTATELIRALIARIDAEANAAAQLANADGQELC